MRNTKTIIIGAGLAGLGCAKTLSDSGHDFIMISKNVGGRVKMSESRIVNYGAVWFFSHYKHIKRIIKLGPRIRRRGATFFKNGFQVNLFKVVLNNPIASIKMLYFCVYFYVKLHGLLRKSEKLSQKLIIESDPYFKKLYYLSGNEFIKKNQLESIAILINNVLWGVFGTKIEEQNAFLVLLASTTLTSSLYEFKIDFNYLISDFKDCLFLGEVTRINKKSNTFLIHTKNGDNFQAQNVVVATEPSVSQLLLNLKKVNTGRTVYVHHVTGQILDKYHNLPCSFSVGSSLLGILNNTDGSFLIYSTTDKIAWKRYFENYSIVAKIKWEPMLNNIGGELLDNKYGENVWLAGDNNIPGMEYAYTTGICAANQIIDRENNK